MRGKLRRRESLPLADRRSETAACTTTNLSPCYKRSGRLILAPVKAWSEARSCLSAHLRLATQVCKAVRDYASSGKGSAPAPQSFADSDPARMAGLAVQAGARFCKRAMLPAAGGSHEGSLPCVEPYANCNPYNTQRCETRKKNSAPAARRSFSCSVYGWCLLCVEAS